MIRAIECQCEFYCYCVFVHIVDFFLNYCDNFDNRLATLNILEYKSIYPSHLAQIVPDRSEPLLSLWERFARRHETTLNCILMAWAIDMAVLSHSLGHGHFSQRTA